MIAAGVFFGAPIPCQMDASNPGTNSARPERLVGRLSASRWLLRERVAYRLVRSQSPEVWVEKHIGPGR